MSDLEIYPFSTQDGKAIPLDILKPSHLFHIPFTTTSSSVELPENVQVAMFMASVSAIISFGAAVSFAGGSWNQVDSLYVPKDIIVSSTIKDRTLHIRGVAEPGSLWVQIIEKWAGLALTKQYSRK